MDYNKLSLREFRTFFKDLAIPELDRLPGTYHASFVGPGWLRVSAGPALALSGLRGWWGKEIRFGGSAVNIVVRAGKYSKCFEMKFSRSVSFVDGRVGLALHYLPGSPFPWMYVVDEIRQVDAGDLIGMTIANVRGLHNLAFPFLLEKTA